VCAILLSALLPPSLQLLAASAGCLSFRSPSSFLSSSFPRRPVCST
jgi:hypothetical protein